MIQPSEITGFHNLCEFDNSNCNNFYIANMKVNRVMGVVQQNSFNIFSIKTLKIVVIYPAQQI